MFRWLTKGCAGLQKGYDSFEKHMEGIRKHIRGWKAPHLERCVSAAVPGGIQLSRIYERQAFSGVTRV